MLWKLGFLQPSLQDIRRLEQIMKHIALSPLKRTETLQQNSPLLFPWSFIMQTHLGKVSASWWEQHGRTADVNLESGVTTAVICIPGIVSSGQARTQLQTGCGVTCGALRGLWFRFAFQSLNGQEELISCTDKPSVHYWKVLQALWV